MISGFFRPSKGSVLVDGRDLSNFTCDLKKEIGYLPENNPLYREMTSLAFLSFVARMKGISRTQCREAISRVVEQCGISSVVKRQIGVLSKGFQQRIGLAQSLLGEPDLLVLDEPTNGLDPKQIIEIRSLIRKLGQERTVLLSSHILPEVQMTCRRVLIIHQGRLVADGTTDDLEKKFRRSEELLMTVRAQEPIPESFFKTVKGVLSVHLENVKGHDYRYRIICRQGQEARSKLARCVLDGGFELLSFGAAEVNLEDLFLQIVTREEGDERS